MHLRAREKNLHSFLRLIQYNLEKYVPSPHMDVLHREYTTSGIGHCVHDRMTSQRPDERLYSTTIPPDDPHPTVWPHDTYTEGRCRSLHVYTDGSKINTPTTRGTGAGYAMYLIDDSGPPGVGICQAYLTLCDAQTVFMAEIIAIREAAKTFVNLRLRGELPPVYNVVIFSDSQAAINALAAPFVTSNTVRECITALNDVSRYANVHIQWIKAHVGHLGNETADNLAKKGGLHSTPCTRPRPYGSDTVLSCQNYIQGTLNGRLDGHMDTS